MATYYYPNSDGSGQSTSNANVRFRIAVTTSIVNSSARTVKLTAALQFRNIANYTGSYYSLNMPNEYTLGICSVSVGTGSTWTMTNITNWTTLITAEDIVTAESNGDITFNTWVNCIGTPTPGKINPITIEDTEASGLPEVTTTYNITLNPEGGKFKCSYDTVWRSSAKTYTVASGATISKVHAEKPGYTNLEWRTAKDGGGRKILDDNGTLLNIGENWNLYPYWQINSYSIYYMFDIEDTEAWQTENCNYNALYAISPSLPVKNGYVFSGWNTKKDGTGTWYSDGNSFTMPARDVYLYAIWYIEPDTITNAVTTQQYKLKNSGSWNSIKYCWIKDNGNWNLIKKFFVKKNGNWE